MNGNYSGKGVKITFSSSEIRLTGVNTLSVVALNVSLPTMHASGFLNIPSITVIADHYTIQGKAFYLYSLSGSGKLDITLRDVNLLFDIRLSSDDNNSTKITDMHIDFAIEDVQANLQNSSWPINKLLNKEGMKILNGYHEEIITATRAGLVKRFDDYLAEVTPTQLLNQIQHS